MAEDGLTIAAMLTANDGSEWSYDVVKNNDDKWQLTITELRSDEEYTLNLQIKGETLTGRPLFLRPEPIILLDETPKVETVMADERSSHEMLQESIDLEQKNNRLVRC